MDIKCERTRSGFMNNIRNNCIIIKCCVIFLLLLSGCQVTESSVEVVTNSDSETSTLSSDSTYIPAKILDVVDGDTMKILIGNKKETIRLLLVDTPETVHPTKPIEPFGKEASTYAKDMLSDQNVEIQLDVSERDKYGRLLCYLYINGKMFNELLLEKGLARVAYVYPPNIKYVDEFRKIQSAAQKEKVGLWSLPDGFEQDNDQDRTQVGPRDSGAELLYKNCKEVRAAGKAPLKATDLGYSLKLDGDRDGVACE
jgi:micrococcal nuclease